MMDADIGFYGLEVQGIAEEYDSANMPITTIKIRNSLPISAPLVKEFAQDMTIMSTVRSSNDPAVKKAFDQLLTVMALTHGRSVPTYDDTDEVMASKP